MAPSETRSWTAGRLMCSRIGVLDIARSSSVASVVRKTVAMTPESREMPSRGPARKRENGLNRARPHGNLGRPLLDVRDVLDCPDGPKRLGLLRYSRGRPLA